MDEYILDDGSGLCLFASAALTALLRDKEPRDFPPDSIYEQAFAIASKMVTEGKRWDYVCGEWKRIR